MDPDDNFSPPLNGLMRGKKLHQVLTTLTNSDKVHSAKNLHEVDESGIGAIVLLSEMVELDEDEDDVLGFLLCNWWHMPREEDWWEYRYVESGPDATAEVAEDEEGYYARLSYECGWWQQPNEEVESLTFFRERGGASDWDWEYEPFSPKFEAPKPLTREIVDSHLLENIKERH